MERHKKKHVAPLSKNIELDMLKHIEKVNSPTKVKSFTMLPNTIEENA